MSGKPRTVYLDNAASTSLSQEAAGVVLDIILNDVYGNGSSVHEMGERIKTLIDAARYGVAQSLGCSSEEIIFTSGGTEANNMALRGIYCSEAGTPNGVVISAGEHPSVTNTVEAIADTKHIRTISLKPCGSLDLGEAKRFITEDTSLVSIMLANNETGVLFPLKKIVKLAHAVGALVHCDAVQAYGKISLDVHKMGVDLLSISGHKVHALPGVGVLYVRKGVLLHPSTTGGGQEFSLRAGTENYIGIASLGTVANEITRHKGNTESGLRDAFETGIRKRIPDIAINGGKTPRIPTISSITFKGIHAVSGLVVLGEQGVLASAGSACSTGSAKPSHTLKSMGLSDEEALSTIRFSFSKLSTIMDIVGAIEATVKMVNLLRNN